MSYQRLSLYSPNNSQQPRESVFFGSKGGQSQRSAIGVFPRREICGRQINQKVEALNKLMIDNLTLDHVGIVKGW
jgi:hypothetical protein